MKKYIINSEFLFSILFIKSNFVYPYLYVLKIIQNISLLFAISVLVLWSCRPNLPINTSCENLDSFSNILLNSYWFSVNEKDGIAISKDSLYFIFRNKNFSVKNEIMIHYIMEDGTFINRDFPLNNFDYRASFSNQFRDLKIYGTSLERLNFKNLALGYYTRENKGIVKYWEKIISADDLNKKMKIYRNELIDVFGVNLLKSEIECALEKGVCFENNKEFSFLIGNGFLYILKPKTIKSEDNFMVHFITDKNKFINKSFNFYNSSTVYPLTIRGKELIVSKLSLPKEEFNKIRIGEYNKNGNLWVQFFSPSELSNNPLLRCKL